MAAAEVALAVTLQHKTVDRECQTLLLVQQDSMLAAAEAVQITVVVTVVQV
jgi:hypothetical protein